MKGCCSDFARPAMAIILSLLNVSLLRLYAMTAVGHLLTSHRLLSPTFSGLRWSMWIDFLTLDVNTSRGSPSGNASDASNVRHSQNDCLEPKCIIRGDKNLSCTTHPRLFNRACSTPSTHKKESTK